MCVSGCQGVSVCIRQICQIWTFPHIFLARDTLGVDPHFQRAEFALRDASDPRASERGDA